MKDQQQQNKEWLKDYPSNVGTVTILTPPKRKVAGLPLPYKYVLFEDQIKKLKEELKAALVAFVLFIVGFTLASL